tara:strand:+ start:363 stop:548 length:186 start_codon:yes stop_codon:yes gene_type:complete
MDQLELDITSSIITNIAIAMIKKRCPDSTPIKDFDMTLGEFKKMVDMTDHEIAFLENEEVA